MESTRECSWAAGAIEIRYQPHLDLGGSEHAAPVAQFIRQRLGVAFDQALEMFAGAGFIGFQLLADGVCRSVDFSDSDPAAVRCVRSTIRRNGLPEICRAYHGSVFTGIPAGRRYDLVVGNPPWAFSWKAGDSDRRECDPGWAIHRAFYRDVSRFLHRKSIVLLLEWKPDEVKPSGSGLEGWDERPRAPQVDFADMAKAGGLEFIGCVPIDGSWNGLHACLSRYEP